MFKRLLVLVACVILFIASFFIYFHVVDSRIENGFAEDRKAFGVDHTVLIAAESPQPPAAPVSAPPATEAPAPTLTTPDSTSAAPAPAPDSMAPAPAAPAPAVTPDQLPSPASAPAPVPAATPAVPAATPAAPEEPIIGPVPPPATPSTMVYPRLGHLAFSIVAAYSSMGARVQASATTPVSGASIPAPSPSAAAPAQGLPPASPIVTSGTPSNGAPFAKTVDNGTPQAVPVEASVIVLGYHQFVGPGQSSKNIYVMRQDVFESEMKYLRDNGYHVIPLSDVVRFIKHEIGLPPNSVAITIDDGYKSAIVWAAPVLKQYGYPWTYFVYPDFITVAEGKGAASWNDLLQLQADGVDVECHSKSHPILTKKGGKTPEQYDAWLTAETSGSKATLEQHLNRTIKYFAYPYGAYNKEVEAKTIAAGYEAIFTVADNPVHTSTSVYSVGRYIITQPVEKAFASYLHQGALSVADAMPAPGATITEARPIVSAILGYAGTLDPNSIEAEVRDFGVVKHDFDPKTSTVRLYLPRDLVQPTVIVNIRAKDAQTGQVMVANWHFNYESAAAAAQHPPITGTNMPPTGSTPLTSPAAGSTNSMAPAAGAPSPNAPLPMTNAASAKK